MDRLSQLLDFYNEAPDDPFNIYALALEYQKHNLNESEKYFQQLLKEHPAYLPSYYHAGKFFQDKNEFSTAKSIFEKGLVLARELNEQKALRELQNAYQELLLEE